MKIRGGVLIFTLGLAMSGVASAQAAPSGKNQLSDILARIGNRDLHTHLTAFNDLMTYVSSEWPKGSPPTGPSDALNNFLTRHPDKADQVKLSLIHLLAEENHLFIETKNPPPDSHDEDDVGEYYAELVDTVSSLNDERAIPALAGAMTTGGMAQRALMKYGDKALQPVLGQLKNPDALVRATALEMGIALLEKRSDPTSRIRIRELIGSSLTDPKPVVRSQAVREIGCLDDRQDFVPILQQIAKNDPWKLRGKADDGGDGDEFYPVRFDARRVLRDIQNNKTCTP